jgi:hypothetical protein
MYIRVPVRRDGLEEVRSQQTVGLRTQELRPGRGGPIRCGIDAGHAKDLPHRRRGDVDPEGEQLAMYPPVSPGRVLRTKRSTSTRI